MVGGKRRLEWALALRSLLIQGSWNYRTLLGTGVAWALLPVLRRSGSDEPTRVRIARAAASFNSHPYLSSLALGALARLELDGADWERTRRFRDAIRSPLGSLGDGLIWAGWRPLCLLAAGILALLGMPPLRMVFLVLLVYNGPNLALRVWGVRAGMESGFQVGEAIRRVRIPEWTERITSAGVLALGLLGGLLVARIEGGAVRVLPWMLGATALFLVGFAGKDSLRTWAPGVLLLLGVLVGVIGPDSLARMRW